MENLCNDDRPSVPTPRLADVVDANERSWKEHRRELRPNFRRVWRDLVTCWVMLVVGIALHGLVTRHAPAAVGWLTSPIAAVWLGFWLAALALFGHEAGHFNLAADRRWNDRLGDWLVWTFFGQSVHSYRKSHWQHHRHLGGPGDTEISYRNTLSAGFLLRAATGLHALSVLDRYRGGSTPTWRDRLPAARSALAHGTILATLVVADLTPTAGAWVLATAVVFPWLATVRQILEHRPFGAGGPAQTTDGVQPATNRMFAPNPFSRWFGAAGFDRHLLHHWDPGISYTRFDEMEQFFQATALGTTLDAARSSYLATWKRLRSDARRI